ncbi:PIEZ1 protein, partial [Erithacus rubecula]|nr:PIEZ1 protein [Erithacus rubecula]
APVPLQLAYQAWVTHTRTVLRQQRQSESRPSSTQSTAERSNVLQRALNTLRFLWLLCQALVDGLTQWLDTCTREHRDMSHVLRLERSVLAERLAKGEEINEGFPDELYVLPQELPGEPSSSSSSATDSQSSASRQRVPKSCPLSSSSQEQVVSLENGSDAQQFLVMPRQRRRTASELLKSR